MICAHVPYDKLQSLHAKLTQMPFSGSILSIILLLDCYGLLLRRLLLL